MQEEILTGQSGKEYRFVAIEPKDAPNRACLFLVQDTRSNSSSDQTYIAHARHGRGWVKFYGEEEKNGLTPFNRIFLYAGTNGDLTIPFGDILSGGTEQVLGYKMPHGRDCP
ncbi:hypothetical protein B0W47_03920 [Komagataeibacter nataicola]|uniref:Uncharacterized protein n=1 Tax=Komagataeibacter nataicola TaxID=265960 RepID=A0A9N7CX94_9PROT|nr:hypothetical protein [Komagataeibacter nataicola]AQU86746.1 hypothetical protein B0W47_03920 [Komagataeibacter nataicola]PYD64846.1 hypothetical protein CDI09_17000 [Komagataeibacter nataicola]WNM07877.1 hypothetical protein RI056_12790 [Komagataeibacter nataicola]GBR23285.1 hypothetical protein AA0616_2483 [Komagataeibacter nataicola NRIC 0616]